MKHKRYFWGIFFISLGILSLLLKYNVIEWNLTSAIDFWPLIFVFWGSAIIAKDSAVRPFISALSALFAVVLVISIFQNIFNKDHFKIDLSNNSGEYYSSYEDSIQYAVMEFNSGAGIFKVNGSTNDLFSAKTWTNDFNYNLTTNQFDTLSRIDFSLAGSEDIGTSYTNKVKMKLNGNPIWDLYFNIGASKGEFDFSDYKIREVELNSGASDIEIKFGDKHNRTYFNADIGAVNLELHIPKDSGCKIKFDQFLISRDIEGFRKISGGFYETENYESAENKIIIDIEGGVSSFKVKRY